MWYQASAQLPKISAPTEVNDELAEQKRMEAEKLAENEAAAFDRNLQKRNPSDYRWLQQVKQSGTTADKVAAATLQVQVSNA